MTKAKNPIQYLDPSTLRIVDEPYKMAAHHPVSKYRTIFSALKPGQRIVCPQALHPAVRPAPQLAGKERPKECDCRARERHCDDLGGVWWIQEDQSQRRSGAAGRNSMSTLLDYLKPA